MDRDEKRAELHDLVARIRSESKRQEPRPQVHVEHAGVLINVMAEGAVLPPLSELREQFDN